MDFVVLAAGDPAEPQTVVLLLDDSHVGLTSFVVTGTHHPDDILDVAHLVGELADGSTRVQAVVLASLRPQHPADADGAETDRAYKDSDDRDLHDPNPDDLDRDEIDRWLELLDLFDGRGVELLDWFLIVPGHTRSLRDMTGMPSAWRGP